MTSPSKKYIGIDPGKSGGITVIRRGYVKTRKCPATVEDMSILFSLMANDRPCEVVVGIEKVWSFPTDSHSTAFTFGMNYGHWLGIIASHDIEPIFVTPHKWQSKMNEILGSADIMIGKQRHGPTGNVKVEFESIYTKFKDAQKT